MEIDQSLDLSQETLFDRLILFTTAGMFALMIFLASFQVFARQLSIPISTAWTEPAARFVLIVATFFGAAVATRNREHIRMTFVLDKLSERRPSLRRAFDCLSSVLVVVFLVFALAGTMPAIASNWGSSLGGVGFVTSGMLYLGISLGLICMLIYELQLFYREYLQTTFRDALETVGGPWN
ncbi:TRAP transporter small permease [Natrarchaeobaculum aegyptiacum]|uniref:Tripartite ATP-independent periplasmic transporters DctQ component domain-containing protein n=1 Tax=Natrarchaeobaculum aegyptiacum TaxID=745377 RepID=A0A2Z2I0G6_9EURY|nr:TRAP transporter small permease subunit [Natrarchaeobaculum aegyptiacum]ARS91024.1 hypothetical protein B1756_15650 [Natrarchaeobaculum aegyptiacum]